VKDLLARALSLVGWLLTLPWRLLRRFGPAGRPRPGTYLAIEIDGAVEEIPAPPRPWPWRLRAPPTFSIRALSKVVELAAEDSRVEGLVVTVRSLHAGFARLASLRAVLARARAAGKRVVLNLPVGGGTREVHLATAADRVLLGPRAPLSPVGLLSSTRYLRGALDRAGVVPDVYGRGRYKTAAEALEKRAMSEPQREQVDAILDRVHGEVLEGLREGRRVDADRARAIVDGAPYVGEEARAAGLVDAVAYDDEVAARLRPDGTRAPVRPAQAYLASRMSLRSRAFQARDVIAVLRLHGPIAGVSRVPPLSSMVSGERIVAAARQLRAHPRVRAVILHVDSPGGSALASDRIHHELTRLAQAKPLVACLGDVAASGGYYAAVAAREIVARPATITGSIGVISARLVLEPLLSKLGVATEVLQRGARARLLDGFAPLDEETRAAIHREIDALYRGFVQVVADGRKRAAEEIEPLAQGRVWSGADAHERGLVDSLGGFEDALAATRRLVGAGAARLRVAVARPPRSPAPSPEAHAARAAAGVLEPLLGALGVDAVLAALSGEGALAYAAAAGTLGQLTPSSLFIEASSAGVNGC
jgi:protease-4